MQRNILFNKNKPIHSKINIDKTYVPSMEYISPINKKKNKKLIIMIRGHIRNSFDDQCLNQLIQELSRQYNITVYLHTWNILQSNKSWRRLEKINTTVTETMITDYFNYPIKKIIIENEDTIELFGNTKGNISISLCPISCWKNMWYGMNQIMNAIDESPETTILNIRFDIFTNRNRLFTSQSIQKLVEQNFNQYLRTNLFITKKPVIGIDNLIFGSIYSMRQLIHRFHHDLDSILEKYPQEIHQEYIVFKETY